SATLSGGCFGAGARVDLARGGSIKPSKRFRNTLGSALQEIGDLLLPRELLPPLRQRGDDRAKDAVARSEDRRRDAEESRIELAERYRVAVVPNARHCRCERAPVVAEAIGSRVVAMVFVKTLEL